MLDYLDLSYVSNSKFAYNQIILAVYNSLCDLNKEYPDFKQWYFFKVLNGLNNNTRHIVMCYSENDIAGVLIAKNQQDEKKISTLRVNPIYQHLGIGSKLIQKSFEILNTESPIITLDSMRYSEFHSILSKFSFKLTATYLDYYRPNHTELCYNGLIEQQYSLNPIRNCITAI